MSRFSNNGLNVSTSNFPDDISIASSNASVLSRQDSGFFSNIQSNKKPPRPSSNNIQSQYIESPMRASSQSMYSPKIQKNINKIVSTPGKLPHHKVGRVKVGIRCRPAFKDEIEFAQGNFMSIIDSKAESNEQLGQISLTLMSGKQREFLYDYSFGSNSTQDQVFDRIARPVVNDVLKGFNGTIFAYGQTGTGKTYTMGILEFVNDEHAGIIPRAISLLFDYVNNQENFSEITISLSFLQLYRETIQDLLAPINGTSVGDDNLAIREDPHRGFYVEGLQEFNVHTYSEAEALLNLGLENRAIAPTLMNATSSRSHTVLTLNIEQRISNSTNSSSVHANKFTRTVRSKLLMVDLAGSERVRRTVSKGTRLSEAKSINTSLSALGNVIAALAETNSTHVPYRDSKLTRLLQDSLGGTASTALIATVGPAAINYGETLSTLQFATRCMAVKTTPVQHEEIDYAEMCTRLQQKLNTIEGDMRSEMVEQQEKYEKIIGDLRSQLEKVNNRNNSNLDSSRVMGIALGQNSSSSFDSHGYESLMKSISEESNNNSNNKSKNWLSEAREYMEKMNKKSLNNNGSNDIISLVSYCYFVLKSLSESSCKVLDINIESEELQKIELTSKFKILGEKEAMRVHENKAMESEDFGLKKSTSDDGDTPKLKNVGSHLAPMTHLEALTRVEGTYRSNNDALSGLGNNATIETMSADVESSLTNYESISDLAQAITTLYGSIHSNFSSISILMQRKDDHYLKLKLDLTAQLVERRKREEEVVNWSYILKYLLSSSSKLRTQLKLEKQRSNIISPIIKSQNFDNTNDDADLDSVLSDNLKNMYKGINFIKDQELKSRNEPNSMRSYETPFSSSNNPSNQKNFYKINTQPIANNYQSELQNNSSPQSNQMKLGSRLAMTKQALLHNQAAHKDVDLDVDQFGDKENEEDDEDEDDDISRSLDERSIVSEVAPSLSNLSFQSAATFNSIPLKVKKPPSMFAQEVVQGLGVEGSQAVQAMSVIDKVAKISAEQLRVMDVETRTQILQIRKELGLDNSNIGIMVNNEGERKKKMEYKNLNLGDDLQNQQRQRAISAPPRQRPIALDSNLNKQNDNNSNNNRGPGGRVNLQNNNNNNNNKQINSIEKNSITSKEKERANYMAEAKRQQRNGNSLFIQSNNSEFRDSNYNDHNDNDVSSGYMKSPRPQKNNKTIKNITPQFEKTNKNHHQNNNNSKSNYYNQNSSFQSYYENNDGDDNFSQLDDLDF